MMRKLRKFILFAGVLALPSLVLGQVLEAGITGGLSMLKNNDLYSETGTTFSLTDGYRLGARMTINTGAFFGHEVGYAYNRTKLKLEQTGAASQEGGMAIHQVFYNFLLYAVPEGKPVRPFVTGGGHFANFVQPGASVSYGQGSTKFGYNYGGGIKARAGSKYMIRFDLRQYRTPKPDILGDVPTAPKGWLSQVEVSAGFGFTM